MFLCTCIRLSYILVALVISKMQQKDIAINNRYESCFSLYSINRQKTNRQKTVEIFSLIHSASSIQIPQSTYRYSSMLPPVYVSPLKLHSATKINLHGVSGSALFRNHIKVRLSPFKSQVLRNSMSN